MKKELPRGLVAVLIVVALAVVVGAGWYMVNKDTMPSYEPERLGGHRK